MEGDWSYADPHKLSTPTGTPTATPNGTVHLRKLQPLKRESLELLSCNGSSASVPAPKLRKYLNKNLNYVYFNLIIKLINRKQSHITISIINTIYYILDL